MPVIAARDREAYGSAMATAILRLLALIALTLMPIGMAGVPAMASPAPAEHAMAGMAHCDEIPAEEPAAPQSKIDCMAMCTALPANFGSAPASRMKPVTPRSIAVSAPFSGIEPEIATPPPKQG
ncbi:MAG TPA: hypothetical protein VGD23_01610 [Sphingomicrobium sp.]